MSGFIDGVLKEQRSLEKTLADLTAKFERSSCPELIRTIESLRAEIDLRKRPD